MGTGAYVALGIATGIAGSLPAGIPLALVMLRGRKFGVGVGLAGVAVSFALLSIAVFAVRAHQREMTLAFGAAMACSFLAVWAVGGLCALGDRPSGHRNEGE